MGFKRSSGIGGTKVTVDKYGRPVSVFTSEGSELDGVLLTGFLIRQSPSEKLIGLVRVKLEMFVYENDLLSTGKFNPTDFIRKTKR